MDRGLSFIFNTTAFPRYHFYQQRLQRLIPRWQKILDAGGLADCKSKGRVKMKQIFADSQQITDKIAVNLFADPSLLKKELYDLPEQSPQAGKVFIKKLKWSSYLKDVTKTTESQPVYTVVVTKSFNEVRKDLENLPESILRDVIIYINPSKKCHLYTDLADKASTGSSLGKHDLVLRKLIHSLLEEKVIIILEMITEYNWELIPRQEEEVDSSLLDAIHNALTKSLRDPLVVGDLSPSDKATEVILGDIDFRQVAEVVGKNWGSLGILLGLTSTEIDHIKIDHQKTFLCSYYMLLLWKKKNGDKASLKDLCQYMEQLNIDTSVVKSFSEERLTNVQEEAIFHKKLTDFVAKKSKCIACDILSKRYGISASLVNEFLNVGFFDYEKKVEDELKKISLPKWPHGRQDKVVEACRLFSHRCTMTLTKTIHETEDYVKNKLKVLTVLKRLQFEIFGQLSQAKVPIHVTIPELPTLPLQLQYELLKLKEVTGCGICYGDLLLHVKRKLFPAEVAEIKELLHYYKFVAGFKTQIMEGKQKTEQALGLLLEQGQELRARVEGDDSYHFGSLGCFVRIKPKVDVSGVSQTKAGSMVSTAYEITEEKDHCLTCAHCLKGCEARVEVRGGNINGYTHFGLKKCFLYQPEALDVASVQVFDDKLDNCDSKLKRSDRVPVENWRTMDVDPIRRDVHKEGCSTLFTRGIVMSTDYMTEKMMEYNRLKFQQTKSLNEQSIPSVNILIESLAGEGDLLQPVLGGEPLEPFEVPHFSKEGDSGSVILADDPEDTENVNVVALLIGAVGRGSEFLHSYASLMTRTIEEIQVQYNCIVTPTRLPPGGEGSQEAVGGGAMLQGHLLYER